MTEMILCGAGASVEAGIPGSFGMTKALFERVRASTMDSRDIEILSFAIAGLTFQQGTRGENPFTQVDVESLFEAIDLLANRSDSEVNPFIAGWHSRVDELDRPESRDSSLRRLADTILDMVDDHIGQALANSRRSVGISRLWSSGRSKSDFPRRFKNALDELMPEPSGGQMYHRTQSRLLQELAHVVWIDSRSRVNYLHPLFELLEDQDHLTIATLNYDNTIELAGSVHRGIEVDTGIGKWSQTGSFDRTDAAVLLLKLHGSIDWRLGEPQPSEAGTIPHPALTQIGSRSGMVQSGRPAIIFGGGNKLRADGPFLDLLHAFRRELAKSSRLTVVGYSFRDPHINVYIRDWLNEDSSRSLRVIDPNVNHLARTGFLQSVAHYARGRVKFMPVGAGKGIRTLFGSRRRVSVPFFM